MIHFKNKKYCKQQGQPCQHSKSTAEKCKGRNASLSRYFLRRRGNYPRTAISKSILSSTMTKPMSCRSSKVAQPWTLKPLLSTSTVLKTSKSAKNALRTSTERVFLDAIASRRPIFQMSLKGTRIWVLSRSRLTRSLKEAGRRQINR